MSTMKEVFDAYETRVSKLKTSTNKFADGVAWVAGQLYPLKEAVIPFTDEGFMHGDLTYDVPSVWDGRYFRLDDHLDRFGRSLAKMRMTWPIPKEEVRKTLVDMVRVSGIKDAFVEIIVTRGLQSVRFGDPSKIKNNLYMFIQPFVWMMSPAKQMSGGGSSIITRTVHRTTPGCMDPTIKNLQWGDLVRAMFEAQDRHADFPFLTDGDGSITEGSGYNIVFIKDGVIYSAERGVLEGVTRLSVMDAAKALGFEMHLQFVPVDLAYKSDEIFMCTTAGGIMPITSLDGEPINGGKIGPITSKIWDYYWKMHYDDKYSFAIEY